MGSIIDFLNCDLPVGHCSLSDTLRPCRKTSLIKPSHKSVIVFLYPYLTDVPHNISLYSVVPDYHTVVKDHLENMIILLKDKYPENEFIAFCDDSPIYEVDAAVRSGLGVLGKNNLLITKEYGSYVFIGCIVTDLVLEDVAEVTHCIDCKACYKNCPGGALRDEFNINLCASHISQKKGELTDTEINAIKSSGLIWGCDICQTVCPLNATAKKTTIKEFTEDIIPIVTSKTATELCKTRAFGWRGDKVILRNIKLMEKEQCD